MLKRVKISRKFLRQCVASNNFNNATPVRPYLTTSIPEVEGIDPSVKCYNSLYKFSIDQPEKFWGRIAENKLQWKEPYSKVLHGDFSKGKARWFIDGKLNASVNCVDRHALNSPDRVALIYEKDEPKQHEEISFRQLHTMVVNYAWALRNVANVKKGDRVAFYMPCGPTAVAMALACTRIGAIHSIVFAGFSSQALASRINDAKCNTVITADIAVRGGKVIDLKKVVNEALESCQTVSTVLVSSRDGNKSSVPMKNGRDFFLDEVLTTDAQSSDMIEYMDSNDPLFMLYTSGSTGKPKGIVHSTAGYLLYAMFTHQNVFDAHPGDRFGCVADIGWITGHSYAMYGPLGNGVTTLLFESTPLYPDPGRYWETAERLKLTHLYCAPTAIRLLLKYGSEWVEKYDKSKLRVLGSVGEPINHDAWEWYHKVVGESKCDVVDTWWQTETGGIMLSPRPSGKYDPIHPAMPMRPFYGVKPKLACNENEGPLCIEQPWPGQALTIWEDHERFVKTYFQDFPGTYFSGDGAVINSEGHWKITGRMDDVINITGHRLGTAEVECAMNTHPLLSETAVVGYPHDVKGEGIFVYAVLKQEGKQTDRTIIEKELRALCKSKIAAFAIPDFIIFNSSLPKTRSGKIMRRILRKIAAGGSINDLGDVSTLAEPSVVHQLIKARDELFANKDKK